MSASFLAGMIAVTDGSVIGTLIDTGVADLEGLRSSAGGSQRFVRQ